MALRRVARIVVPLMVAGLALDLGIWEFERASIPDTPNSPMYFAAAVVIVLAGIAVWLVFAAAIGNSERRKQSADR